MQKKSHRRPIGKALCPQRLTPSQFTSLDTSTKAWLSALFSHIAPCSISQSSRCSVKDARATLQRVQCGRMGASVPGRVTGGSSTGTPLGVRSSVKNGRRNGRSGVREEKRLSSRSRCVKTQDVACACGACIKNCLNSTVGHYAARSLPRLPWHMAHKATATTPVSRLTAMKVDCDWHQKSNRNVSN